MGNLLGNPETEPHKKQKKTGPDNLTPFLVKRCPDPARRVISDLLAPIDHDIQVLWKMYKTGDARIELTWLNSKKKQFCAEKTIQYKTILYNIAKRMHEYHGVPPYHTPLIVTLPDKDTEFIGDTVFYTDLPVLGDSPASMLYKYWDAKAFADDDPQGQLPETPLPNVTGTWNIERFGNGYSFDHDENMGENHHRHYVLRTADVDVVQVHGDETDYGPPVGWNLADLDFFYETSWPTESILFKSSDTWNTIRNSVFYDILNKSLVNKSLEKDGIVKSRECIFPCKQYDDNWKATGGKPMYSIVEQGNPCPVYELDWKEGIGFPMDDARRLESAHFPFDMCKKNSTIHMTDDTPRAYTLGPNDEQVENIFFIWRIDIVSKTEPRMPVNRAMGDLAKEGFKIYEKNKLNLKF